MTIIISIIAIVVLFFVYGAHSKSMENKEYMERLNRDYDNVIEMANREGVNVDNMILSEDNKLSYNLHNSIKKITTKIDRTLIFREKYNGDELNYIVDRKPWIGMTIEHLVDMLGKPTNIEITQNTRTKHEVYIYGHSKRSGDVFKFRNGSLHEYKDR